jgi:hypothetical protein
MANSSALRTTLAFVAAATLAGCATVNGSNDNGHTVLGDLKSSATELGRKGSAKVAELRVRGTLTDAATYAPLTLSGGKQVSFAEIVVTQEDKDKFRQAASDAATAVVANVYPAPGTAPADSFVPVGTMNGVKMGFNITREETTSPGKPGCSVATLLAAPDAPVVAVAPAKPGAKKGAAAPVAPAQVQPQVLGFGKVCL